MSRPIILFTDFGSNGPYVGQMKLKLLFHPGRIVDLMHDAPSFDPIAAGLILDRLVGDICKDAVVVAVIDPGVGSARRPLIVEMPDYWLIGPDNGLFAPFVGRGKFYEITWRPENLSATFHGRDLFAPVALKIADGEKIKTLAREIPPPSYAPARREQVIYFDAYGNAWTGIDAKANWQAIEVKDHIIARARTFSDVPRGQLLAYENSSGLVEIAANQASAQEILGLELGQSVRLI